MVLIMGRDRNALVMLLTLVIFIELLGQASVKGNVVFNVTHKYGGRRMARLSTLKAHDRHRHGRYLAGVNIPVGGDGRLIGTGLYYTKLAIGTPPKDYLLHIDTGSDLMWVACAGCKGCKTTSKLGFNMSFYDMKTSSSGKQVSCDEDTCEAININKGDNIHKNPIINTCPAGNPCEFKISYFDGNDLGGNVVRDNIKFEESSNKSMDASIAFGCSTRRGGSNDTSTDEVDGLIGFGRAKYSIIQQLASSNKTPSVFSHCFDGRNGGGVFAIGRVVEPQVKTMVPLMRTEQHYTIALNSIHVNGKAIQTVSKNLNGFSSGIETVLDSGATLAYLPSRVYEQLIKLIISDKPDLELFHNVENDMTCFKYKRRHEDKDFPSVAFQFGDSASLKVCPHNYLVQLKPPDEWCFGWQKGDFKADKEVVLLGDMALTNKLFVYDIEKEEVGWTEYDCTGSIKVKGDNGSGNAVAVNATNLSPPDSTASRRKGVNGFTFPLMVASVLYAYLII